MRGVKELIVLKNINLGLRFLLELTALISLGYWGFKTRETLLLKLCFGIGLPLITAIIWGVFGSPKAVLPLFKPFKWILLIAIYLTSAFALYRSGMKNISAIFLITAVTNSVLMYIWKQ